MREKCGTGSSRCFFWQFIFPSLYLLVFAPSLSLFFIYCVLDFLFFFLDSLICLFLATFISSFFLVLFSLLFSFSILRYFLSTFIYFSFCYVFARMLMLMNQENKYYQDAGCNCCCLRTGAQATEENHRLPTRFSWTLGAAHGRSMPWHAGLLCLRTRYRRQSLQLAGVTRGANIADVGLEASIQWVQRLSYRVYRNTRNLRFYAPCHSDCCINFPPFSRLVSKCREYFYFLKGSYYIASVK